MILHSAASSRNQTNVIARPALFAGRPRSVPVASNPLISQETAFLASGQGFAAERLAATSPIKIFAKENERLW
jgi:hypothetical protein